MQLKTYPIADAPGGAQVAPALPPRTGERAICLAIVLIMAVGAVSSHLCRGILEQRYLAEDGVLEWVTVALLMFLAADRSPRMHRLVERFAIPLPTRPQSLDFFPAALLPNLPVASSGTDETIEVCRHLMLTAIFLYPGNRELFSPDRIIAKA